MEVSSSSMKVARVTVRAMTQGLMMGRLFGLAAGRFELAGDSTWGPAGGVISSTAVAKVWPSLSLSQQIGVGGDRHEIYI